MPTIHFVNATTDVKPSIEEHLIFNPASDHEGRYTINANKSRHMTLLQLQRKAAFTDDKAIEVSRGSCISIGSSKPIRAIPIFTQNHTSL